MFCAGSNTAVQGNIACVAAHNLYNEKAVVRIGGIAYFVDGFHGGIDRGIKANGKVGAGNIFIDGTGQADTGDVEFVAQLMGSPEGTVPADDDQTIDSQLLQVAIRLFPALVFEKFLATGGLQDRPPPLNDVGHAPRMHGYNIILDHPTIPPHDAEYLHSIIGEQRNKRPEAVGPNVLVIDSVELAFFDDIEEIVALGDEYAVVIEQCTNAPDHLAERRHMRKDIGGRDHFGLAVVLDDVARQGFGEETLKRFDPSLRHGSAGEI